MDSLSAVAESVARAALEDPPGAAPPSKEQKKKCGFCRYKKRLLRKKAASFFDFGEGMRFEPKQGVNYTLQSLAYMSTPEESREIAALLAPRLPRVYCVTEVCAGIGGNTVAFLRDPRLASITTYEADEDRRAMLAENLYRLGFRARPGARGGPSWLPDASGRHNSRAGFDPDRIDPEVAGTVVFVDPPWSESKCICRKNYKKKGITLGKRTLEQIVEVLLERCPAVVLKLPPEYKMGPVAGCRALEVFPLAKMQLYVYRIAAAPTEDERRPGGSKRKHGGALAPPRRLPRAPEKKGAPVRLLPP